MAIPSSRGSGPYRPTQLGQWEVIAKIAGGGMSAVYLGRSIESPPDSPNVVALKIARHGTEVDERILQMFLEEGKLLARLDHPNIVRTLEVGGDKQQDFIAMELMLGKTFAAIHDTIAARGVRLGPELAAWTAARVADALHYAHELADESGRPLALVHRDVNPANVFATFGGEVKLFDFGLAKVTADESASSQQMLAGKLSYLSPEQVMQKPIDRRSDIFSLGTTLWELLTSKRLFRRDSDIDTVRAVQLGPIPDPRTLAPDLPEDLTRIVKSALERNRDHRYPTAAHLARELDAWLNVRTSPQDVTAKLAQLVDTLFPGEQKRQSGWLKPAISMGARAAPSPPSSMPRPPEIRRDTRETTAVMAHPPVPTPRDGIPSAPSPAPSSNPRTSWPVPSRPSPSVLPPPPRAPAPTPRIAAPPPRTRPPPPPAALDLESTIVAPKPPESAPGSNQAPPSLHGGRARPKRAPIPLPSRASVPPKPNATGPFPKASIPPAPDSEKTQVDVPGPPAKKR